MPRLHCIASSANLRLDSVLETCIFGYKFFMLSIELAKFSKKLFDAENLVSTSERVGFIVNSFICLNCKFICLYTSAQVQSLLIFFFRLLQLFRISNEVTENLCSFFFRQTDF